MTIYDREYYRREGPSFLGAFAHGQACKWLILANVGIFVLQLFSQQSGASLTSYLLLDVDSLRHGEVWRLLSYAFAHDTQGWMHILFNMLFLWWFGTEIEVVYGTKEFLAFYLTAAVLSGLAFAGAEWHQGGAGQVIGASGAVTAVMVLFALHYPTHRIYIWFLFPIPIWLFVGFQVLQDTYLFTNNIPTRTAVACHLGGALFGFVYYRLHWRILSLFGWLPNVRWKQLFRAQPKLRVYREEESQPVSVAAPPPGIRLDEHLEAQLDAILEKLSRSGQGSLTPQERDILLRASEAYKRRRH
jgi:membrane associated rhomboid family serine protease